MDFSSIVSDAEKVQGILIVVVTGLYTYVKKIHRIVYQKKSTL